MSSSNERNLFKLKYSELLQNQSIYIYSFIDVPIFKSITLIWDNSNGMETLDYQQYLTQENKGLNSGSDDVDYYQLTGKSKNNGFFDTGFGLFLEVMAALIIIAFSIFLVYAVIMKLSQIWKIE